MENKRICEKPTKEDELYFPDMVGTDWLKQHHFAIKNFRDESFITQYLSPAMVKKERMFDFTDDEYNANYVISDIQNERGFPGIRSALSDRYKLSKFFPDIQITGANMAGDRTLTLQHNVKDGIELDRKSAQETVNHIEALWGYPVVLHSVE
jgi:spore cortex formation protein SpoVR/YcgB (stage V sporulation)